MFNELLTKAIAALFRHLLGSLGGALLGLGLTNEVVTNFISSSEQVLVGIAGMLVAYLLSLANAKKMLKRIGY